MIAPRQTPEFEKWLSRQDDRSQAKIEVRLKRLQKGNPGDHKSLGEGVFELRIHHGPGYRVYFVPQGTTVIII